MGSSTNIILPNYGESLTTGKRNNIDVVLWYIVSPTTHWGDKYLLYKDMFSSATGMGRSTNSILPNCTVNP
jgi:hypothetical protein